MNPSNHKDVLIVGQGLAGTLFSYICLKHHKSVDVVDNAYKSSASYISSGLINPITGRRYVKSWKYEELKSYFVPFYREMGELLQSEFIREVEILRVLQSAEAKNAWDSRLLDEAYSPYMSCEQDKKPYEKLLADETIAKICGCYQVDIQKLLELWRQYLWEKHSLIEMEVDSLDIHKHELIQLKGRTYDKIIYCTGADARKDKLWDFIPFNPAKGEVIIDNSGNFQGNKVLKYGVSFIPLADGNMWIGSNYIWDFDDDKRATEEGLNDILSKLKENSAYDPKIMNHLAAVRPTIKDRRPVIGKHPQLKDTYILNGLGTKGMSLGPYCASKLYNFIFYGEKLPKEIDVMRF